MGSRDIFICYASSDVVESVKVATYLENHGRLTCWYAERDMPGYENTDLLLQMINESSVFLFISSPNTADNHNVQVAVSHALALGKDRVELKIEDEGISDQAFTLCFQQINRFMNNELLPEEIDEPETSSSLGRRIIYIIILILGVTGGVLTFNSISGRLEEQMLAETEPPGIRALLMERATEGEAEAQYEMGRLLMIIQEFDEATYWFRQAAEQGHRRAQSELATNYNRGVGTHRDHVQAAYWYYQAEDTNDPFIQFTLGQMFRDGNVMPSNQTEAMHWFREAAEQDMPEAQVSLGYMYVQANEHEQAIYWYKRAAEMGDPYAQNNLGLMYSLGQGVPQSQEEALRWYRLAAERNMPGALVSLGWMYEFGQGVEMDLEQAAYWYNRAAELGSINGMNNLGVVQYRLQQYDLAVSWFRQTAEIYNDPRGMGLLGYMYEIGQGVEQDYDMAIYWYARAMDEDQDWVATMYQSLVERMENTGYEDA